jgi:AhpD family alkylhydroperoxidase
MDAPAANATTYPDRYRAVLKKAPALGAAQPDVMKSFGGLHKAGTATGALNAKTKELMALAISIVVRCDDCIAYHIHDAIEAGATREELADAIGVAVLMGGGPSMMYATHAIEAVDQFLDLQG